MPPLPPKGKRAGTAMAKEPAGRQRYDKGNGGSEGKAASSLPAAVRPPHSKKGNGENEGKGGSEGKAAMTRRTPKKTKGKAAPA